MAFAVNSQHVTEVISEESLVLATMVTKATAGFAKRYVSARYNIMFVTFHIFIGIFEHFRIYNKT